MEILFLFPVFLLCLFILYLLSKQDFVLLRQNISLAQIFDSGIITLFLALIVSRLFYIINTSELSLLNVLRFFHILKFPGLSTLGFFIGGALVLILLFRNKKGLRRIGDIFSISFLPLFGGSVLLTKNYSGDLFFVPVIILVILTFVFLFYLTSYNKYTLRDGTISYTFLFIVSLNTFIGQIFYQGKHILLLTLTGEQIISLVLGIFVLVLAVANQKFLKS